MKTIPILAFILSLAFAHAGTAAEPVLPGSPAWDSSFDGERALSHVFVLASDSLRGRYSGFAGADKAEAYVAGHFKQLGLKEPFGKDGYFHNFTYGAGEYSQPTSFMAFYPDGRTDSSFLWEDYNVYKYSGFGKVRGRVVFVGYGISAPDKGWDEYEELDVEGAIVLAMRGTPPLKEVEWDDESASGYKSTLAIERGAVGFIMTEGDPPKYATIMEKYYREELPAVWISSNVADSLLASTGKSKQEWQKLIGDSLKPVSRELDVEVEFQVSGEYYPKRPTRNVAGVLQGQHPRLKHEVIIIGAHMDHHGVDAAGNIYPGADDNASGTSAMMELAEVFAQSGPFGRSIMFMGFAAEEEGLVGSKAFAESLPLKDYDVVTMLNMDMVGQGNGTVGVGGIPECRSLESFFVDWPDSALRKMEFWRLWHGSDHRSFYDAGIPSYVVGAPGPHPNYHTPNDTAGAIKPDVMKAVGDMMFHCAAYLANDARDLNRFTGKAKMLVNEIGGITFTDALNRKEAYTVESVPYPTSIHFQNLSSQEMVWMTGDAPPREDLTAPFELNRIIINLERHRTYYETHDFTMMADSTQNDYKGVPFTGVVFAMPPMPDMRKADVSKSSLLTKEHFNHLARNGVSFVRDPYTDPTPEMESRMSETEVYRSAGVRPIFYANRDKWRFKSISAKSWKNQAICYIFTSEFKWKELDNITESGCFALFTPTSDPDLLDKFIKYFSKVQSNNVGVVNDQGPEIVFTVDYLLNNGFTEKQIKALLRDNLRRKLSTWWSDPSYANP